MFAGITASRIYLCVTGEIIKWALIHVIGVLYLKHTSSAKRPESSSHWIGQLPGVKGQVEQTHEEADMKSCKFSEEIRKNMMFAV